MVQPNPWKFHQPGHTADIDLCCCEPSDRCRPYLPCCVRDYSASVGVLVVEDDFDTGPLGLARVRRWRLTNLCNSQTSVDWSWLQDVDSDAAAGEVDVEFNGGAAFQSCHYGIDISLEDLFCECGQVGLEQPNFRWTVTLCNPNDVDIYVQFRNPDFCFSFDGDRFCCLNQIGAQVSDPILIPAGTDIDYSVEFKRANYKTCIDECYRIGPPAIIRGPGYFDDGLDATCLRPIGCLGEVDISTFDGEQVDSCEDSLCPDCECLRDDDCPFETCCACGCDGVEAMNSCGPPKELCAGCSADSGSITICEAASQGFGAAGPIIRCINTACKLTMEIRRDFNTNLWTFVRFGSPGTGASVTNPTIPHCEDFEIEWNIGGGFATLTVNGTSASLPLPVGYDPILPAGTCYVVASFGSTFTLK